MLIISRPISTNGHEVTSVSNKAHIDWLNKTGEENKPLAVWYAYHHRLESQIFLPSQLKGHTMFFGTEILALKGNKKEKGGGRGGRCTKHAV